MPVRPLSDHVSHEHSVELSWSAGGRFRTGRVYVKRSPNHRRDPADPFSLTLTCRSGSAFAHSHRF
jgi:hypothetical protein